MDSLLRIEEAPPDAGLLGTITATTRPFIVYSLPRSRTAWLASFLSYRDWSCHHEVAIYMRYIDQMRRFFAQPNTGTVETGVAQGWWLIHHHVPGIRAVVIRRPIDDVMRSMLAVDLRGEFSYDEMKLRKVMEYGDRMLARISAQPDVLTINGDDLAREDACAAIFEHCLPYRFDPAWWRRWKDCNVQIDVVAMLRYFNRNRPAIERFKAECWSELRALARAGLIARRNSTHGFD